MSCAFIDIGSMAIQGGENRAFVSLVPLDSQVGSEVVSFHHQPGQIFIQTNGSDQPSLSYSTLQPPEERLEPHEEERLEPQEEERLGEPTLLLVSTNPDDSVGHLALTQKVINHSPPVRMQQLVLLTDLQEGTNQGGTIIQNQAGTIIQNQGTTVIQMPCTGSVIEVPGLISARDETEAVFGSSNQTSQLAIHPDTVLVANPSGGDIILCLQPGEVTTLFPSNLVVDGSTGSCYTTTTIESNDSLLARTWQLDSDLVNRALVALSTHTSSPQNCSPFTPSNTSIPAMEHLCSHTPLH